MASRLLGIVPVAQGQLAAHHAELAGLPYRGLGVVVPEDQHPHIGPGIADGQRIGVREFPVHVVDRAVHGDLGGAVEVGVEAVRQRPAPDVQLLVGHDLSGKDHGLEVRQRHGIQCSGVGHAAHDGGHPEDAADLLLGHVFHQLHRVHKEDFRNNQHLGPGEDRGVEVKDRVVKVEARLEADHRVF